MTWTISCLAVALALAAGGVSQTTENGDVVKKENSLVDFSEPDTGEWIVVNDRVMGGVSESTIRLTDEGTGLFEGILSLENNGGFASVRLLVKDHNLAVADGLSMRVRGDGRTYQLRIRTNKNFDGVAYRTSFETVDGEWITVRIPFDAFEPGFRGRTVLNAPPLDPSEIQQVGFMLADKHPGPFSLEIDFVDGWTADE